LSYCKYIKKKLFALLARDFSLLAQGEPPVCVCLSFGQSASAVASILCCMYTVVKKEKKKGRFFFGLFHEEAAGGSTSPSASSW
jgi:hypothetical protein